jgi:glycosyltransferase involved in cell wall biosynthesis
MPIDGRKNILYVESNIDGTIGGSYFSLLYLIQGLDKTKYVPFVAFYQENSLMERYEKAGCKVFIIDKVRPLEFFKQTTIGKLGKRKGRLFLLFRMPFIVIQKMLNFLRLFLLPSYRCIRFLRKENIDLIHLNNTLLRPQEWILASFFTGSRVVAHERGINDSFPFLSRMLAKRLDAIFCISKAVRAKLLSYGFPQNQLKLVYNGLDHDVFTVSRPKESILKEFGLSESDYIIGLVGNIKPWKGQEILVRAMELIVEKYANIRCLLIGATKDTEEYFNYICDLINKNNLEGNIFITGFRDDVPSLVNILDVVVHTSVLPEPFGRVLLEGMVLRKPVVTPDIGAGPEIVEDGKTGIVFTSGDHVALSNSIVHLFENPEKAEEMGNAGYRRAVEYFHIRNNVENTEKIYAGIFSNQPSRVLSLERSN